MGETHQANRQVFIARYQLDRRRFLGIGAGLAGAASLSSILAACQTTSTDDEPEADAGQDDVAAEPDEEEPTAAAEDDDAVDDRPLVIEIDGEEAELPDEFEPFELSELDLDTLQGEIPDATLDAQPWNNTWVGEVTEDLFIGLQIAEEYGNDPREVTAYLCDNDIQIVLEGDLAETEASLANDEAELDLELIDGEVTGTVTLADQEPITFSAEEATGDGGVYVAEHAIGDMEVAARWIVLPDGRQRGGSFCRVCTPPPNSRCGWVPCYHLN
jgi:hypothetical protein